MSVYEDKVFPVLLDWATRPLYRNRQHLIRQARGKVLELGVGTGANFPLYSDLASEIHGIEPAEALLELAADTARQCNQPERFHLRVAGAEQLPYDDNSFDSVIACLVFCTIPEPELAARYGIQSIPALRLFKNGELVNSLQGAQPKADLDNWLNANA